MKVYWLAFAMLIITGCGAGNTQSADPVERGLSYIAGAIITSAIIRALCNK